MKISLTLTCGAYTFTADNYTNISTWNILDDSDFDNIVHWQREMVDKLNANGSWVSPIARKGNKEVNITLQAQAWTGTIETLRTLIDNFNEANGYYPITVSRTKTLGSSTTTKTYTAYLSDDILWREKSNTAEVSFKLTIPTL